MKKKRVSLWRTYRCQHVVRDRMGIYRRSHGAHIENVGRNYFVNYNLVYQLGESLIAELG